MDLFVYFFNDLRAAFGLGPKFIMAEPGTDPLAEPEIYKRRRRRGVPVWVPFLFGLIAIATTWGAWFYLRAR